VSAQVSGDHVTSAGGVGALGAAVGFLARVGALVGAEVVRAGEDLTASAARVRFETGVQAHVTGQHVAAGERTLADVALVALDHFIAAVALLLLLLLLLLLGFMTRCQVLDEAVVDVEALAAELATEGRCRVADERRLGQSFGGDVVGGGDVGRVLDGEVLRQGNAPRQQLRGGRRRSAAEVAGGCAAAAAVGG